MKVIVEVIGFGGISDTGNTVIEMTAEEAVKVLTKALTTDKSYFEAWQANICMAFIDNAAWFKKSNTGKRNTSNADIKRIATKAADYFIEQLTGVKIDDMDWNKEKGESK